MARAARFTNTPGLMYVVEVSVISSIFATDGSALTGDRTRFNENISITGGLKKSCTKFL